MTDTEPRIPPTPAERMREMRTRLQEARVAFSRAWFANDHDRAEAVRELVRLNDVLSEMERDPALHTDEEEAT